MPLARRTFLKTAAAALCAELEAYPQNVNRNSKPSELKITDMRIAELREGSSTWTRTVIRLDTNQGLRGYGEGYLGGSKTSALILKSRIMGMNPCNVSEIFYKIKQHGSHGVMGGGVSAVEMACWDLAGKAWGVPVWQMLGGKFRDRILLYADTTSSRDPAASSSSRWTWRSRSSEARRMRSGRRP